jgi:hypothetical protein
MPTAQQVYAMLGNQSLWDVVQVCHAALTQSGVPYAVMGGVAVCLHGYQRNTVDLDLLIRREDQESVRQCLTDAGLKWSADRAEFVSPFGVSVQFLLAGDRAGRDSEVRLPDPAEERTTELCDGLPVLKLARLIESKLACGQGSLRRTHKDYADVVELIAVHSLSRSFARHLHPSLRESFRKLVEAARER